MALTPQPLFRAQDTGTSTVLGPIARKNWNTHANKVNFGTLANANAAKPRYNQSDYIGGVKGDDVLQNTANVAVARADGGANEPDYTPRLQQDKPTALGTVFVQDVGRKRGTVAPAQPYPTASTPALLAPTITSLSPNTAVAGSATPQFAMKIIGTNFTLYSSVLLAGVPAPSSIYTYISPTEMRCQMSPGSSSAGTTSVTVVDHGVATTPGATFTWT